MAFDEQKYKDIFNKRYGAGAFDTGLSSARNIGRTKAQAGFEKLQYNARLKETEKAQKEAQKKAEKKTYEDALSYWSDPANNALLRKQGASRNAENIRNDPRLQSDIKAQGFSVNDYIDAMYNAASNGQFRSEREFKQFATGLKKEVKTEEDDVYKKYGLDKPSTQKKEQKKGDLSVLKKKNHKDNNGSLLNDILAPLKRFGQAINPFDNVSIKEAIQGNVDDALSTDRSKLTKETTRGLTRIANTGTLGALDQVYKKTNDGKKASQFKNEDRSTVGKVADFGYDAMGYLVPGMGAYKAVRGAGLGIKEGAKGATKIRQLAQEGAITGGGIGAGEVIVREGLNPQDTNYKDNLKHIGLGTAAGAIADPALYGLGKMAQSGLSRFAKGDVPTYSGNASNEVVNQLRPSTSPNNSGASTEFYDRLSRLARPKGEMLPDDNLALANRVRQSQVDAYNQEFNQAVEQQFQYLKNSMGKGVDHGTTSNGLGGNHREVSGSYSVSRNPKWYQDFYAQNGRRPNNAELRALAEKHVLEGFDDEVGSLPPWRPQAVQEIDDQILELETLLRQSPEQEPALKPILEALEQDRTEAMRSFENIDSAPVSASNEPSLSRLGALRASEPIQQPSLDRLRAGRDFEPIESSVNEPPLRRVSDALLDTQRQSQGNMDSFRSRVNDTPQEKDSLLKGIRTQFIDDVAPLESIEKQIAGKIGSAENSLYKQARLFRGSPEKAHMIVQEQLSPVLRDLQKSKINYKDLRDYALAIIHQAYNI